MINKHISEGIETKRKLLLNNNIKDISDILIERLGMGNKIIIAGNGGSAADSQHFSAELVGRYKKERKSIAALSLTTDTSILTAIGNDYGYDKIFSRQLESMGNNNDIFIIISTSGNSQNLIEGVIEAKKKGMSVIGLLGKDGGKLKDMCHRYILVPSDNTPIIQECHIMIIHILCELIEL